MLSPLFKEYVRETIALVRSMVFKSSQTIEAQNNYLKAAGYLVTEDPTTWRYYLNLAGRYHHSERVIEVISSDTQEVIPFTREGLVGHPLSQLDYAPGGEYYHELLEQYPDQRLLIPRVTHPIDMRTAIEADDWTILQYDESLVADNEYSLMRTVQNWVDRYRDRWHLAPFAITDPLYPASAHAVLVMNLVPTILLYRVETARTAEVDEFHRWMYLGSRYRLDRYRNYLTPKQSLYLYRNIDYLRHHVGKEATMDDLLMNITEPVGIEAHRHDVTVNQEHLIESRQADPMVLVSPFQQPRPSYGVDSRRSLDYIYQLTRDVARDNPDRAPAPVAQEIATTPMQTLPTGTVSMTVNQPMADRFANPEQLRAIQWLYLCSLRRFQTVHEINMGERGVINVSAREAAVLFCYAAAKVSGSTLYTVPGIWLGYHHREAPPAQSTLAAILDRRLLDAGYVGKLTQDWVPLPIIRGEDDLGEYVGAVKDRHYLHQVLARRPQESGPRSQLKAALRLLYPPTIVWLEPEGTRYDDWLATLGFPTATFQPEDYYALAMSILSDVVGIDVEDGGITRRHRAMVDIMQLLSSYSISFVEGSGIRATMTYHYGKVEPVGLRTRQENSFKLSTGIYGDKAATREAIRGDLGGGTGTLSSDGKWRYDYHLGTGMSLHALSRTGLTEHLETANAADGTAVHRTL